MADMQQRCWRRTGNWTFWEMSSLYFRLQRNAWNSVLHAMRQPTVFWLFSTSPYLTVTCSEFASGVHDYGFFWEMPSWFISVFSSCVGSTPDTCLRQYLVQTANCGVSAVAVLFLVVDIPFVTQRLFFLGLFSRPEFPQLPFIDKVFDVPCVQVHMSSLSRRRG